jgi:hypothetical protein
MKNKVTIFVENVKIDKDFINFLLFSRYGFTLDVQDIGGFVNMSGMGKEKSHNEQKFIESIDNQCINLLFEDADYKNNSPYGFEKQKERLDILSKELKFEYFLFPNNQDDGNIELLLQNCLQPTKKEITSCLDSFYSCIESKGGNARRPKDYHKYWNVIQLYLQKDDKLDFADDTIWWIDENPYLKPLIDFLNKFFQ